MTRLAEVMNLRGRVAIVTGGAGRLGTGFSETLSDLGAAVVVMDTDAGAAEALSVRLRDRYSSDSAALAVDITSEDQVGASISRVMEQFGRIDILVNNAAYARLELPPDGLTLEQQSLAQWETQLRVILDGSFLVTRACAPHLAAGGGGSIVNIASIYGLVGPVPSLYDDLPMVNEAYYAAGKGGIVQLTRYLSTMLAPQVRVNCIAPGGILAEQDPEFRRRYAERTPLARMAEVTDIVGALAFFVSDASAYVTGQTLAVDGGWTAW